MPLEVRFHPRLSDVDAAAWDALRVDDNPFLGHAFLSGLETSGSLRAEYGWRVHHVCVYADSKLVAATPLYLKGNSHGEFIFDWSWASAYERAGLRYYPKLLGAVPYSPVTGARLLVRPGENAAALRAILIEAIAGEVERRGLSSAHINFVTENDAQALDRAAWLARFDWQFHWQNRPENASPLSPTKSARTSALSAPKSHALASSASCVTAMKSTTRNGSRFTASISTRSKNAATTPR
jgi:predicted N-acyltransferase